MEDVIVMPPLAEAAPVSATVAGTGLWLVVFDDGRQAWVPEDAGNADWAAVLAAGLAQSSSAASP